MIYENIMFHLSRTLTNSKKTTHSDTEFFSLKLKIIISSFLVKSSQSERLSIVFKFWRLLENNNSNVPVCPDLDTQGILVLGVENWGFKVTNLMVWIHEKEKIDNLERSLAGYSPITCFSFSFISHAFGLVTFG